MHFQSNSHPGSVEKSGYHGCRVKSGYHGCRVKSGYHGCRELRVVTMVAES